MISIICIADIEGQWASAWSSDGLPIFTMTTKGIRINLNNTIMGHNFRGGGAASLSIENVLYNIHIRGHSPQGLMPRVIVSKDKYEIILDISVLGDGFIRKGAYTYLEITRDNKMYIRGFFPYPIIHIEQSKYVNKNEKGYSYNFPLDVYISEAFDN